ncbi:hypothetical protein KO02_17095 [Sphingobacterium sp. ML3W]|uniref:SH3 domain-containing protein n=1 Tax=Sphingobacterium sp. ML3W TaxID=1538644 RepID=UPI0004F8F5A3|nr:SH3 domain-containing protein [Sphingobacterium sp. ML3W]AIM38206.1 hypothetical protein KO02_17095 [Sphingobacterium sp. ML3W]
MKKTMFLLLFVLTSLFVRAQEQPTAYAVYDEFDLWNFSKGDTAYIFADIAYIRSNASTNATLIDSITAGNSVVIASEGYNGNTIRGFHAPWYKITYIKNNVEKEGFIWLGLLALNSIQNEDGEQFIYGFKKFKPSTEYAAAYYEAQIKVFNKEKNCIARADYQADVNDQLGTETKILPAMGLKNIKNIHRSAFLSESCGVSTQYYYFAWNGHELIHFPNKMTVSDAGVFYHDETILFPSEHLGDQNMIIKRIIEGENTSEDMEDPKYQETKSQINYIWDGTTLSEIMEMR